MDADLSRRAARIMQSPLYLGTTSGSEENQEFVEELVEAGTFDELDDDTQAFIEKCDRSIKIAESMGYKDSNYSREAIAKVMQKLASEVKSTPLEIED